MNTAVIVADLSRRAREHCEHESPGQREHIDMLNIIQTLAALGVERVHDLATYAALPPRSTP
jgi:hypothetical protein